MEMAPEAIENMQFATGNGTAPKTRLPAPYSANPPSTR